MNSNNAPQTLIPHSYPIWIKIAFGLTISFLLFSFRELPFYSDVNKKRKKADIEFNKGNFQTAYMLYAELLETFPNNKYLKKCTAKSLFKSSKDEDHLLGIKIIADLSFSNYEWKDIYQSMPKKYQEMCDNIKGKK